MAPARTSFYIEGDSSQDGLDEAPRLADRRPQRAISMVRGMTATFTKEKTVGTTPTERMFADVASPMALFATINPQYTLEKARELYGGEPRPLSARHEFVRQAFLSDTEDWRGNACVGSKNSAVAKMNIVDPKKSEYLNSTSSRKMSYYRERSLARAVSSRAVLVKADGNLAVGQYHDQYYSKEKVARDLKASFSMKSMRRVDPNDCDNIQRGLAKSMSRAPDRVLVQSLSRAARPSTAPAVGRPAGISWGPDDATSGSSQPKQAENGMSRAISRIMTRGRAKGISFAATTKPAAVFNNSITSDVQGDVQGNASMATSEEESSESEHEDAPTFDDL